MSTAEAPAFGLTGYTEEQLTELASPISPEEAQAELDARAAAKAIRDIEQEQLISELDTRERYLRQVVLDGQLEWLSAARKVAMLVDQDRQFREDHTTATRALARHGIVRPRPESLQVAYNRAGFEPDGRSTLAMIREAFLVVP